MMGLSPLSYGRQGSWSVTDIKENAFTRLGKVSRDGGVTWMLEQEMFGGRQVAG